MIFEILLKSFWFFLPGYFTNMAASLSSKIKFLEPIAIPIDGGKKFMGKPLLGNHKTLRGYLAGIVASLIAVIIQHFLYNLDFFNKISVFDYSKNFLLFGFLLGLGSLLGDSLGAFIKRRFNIKPGQRCLFVDQICFVVGGLALVSIIYVPKFEIWLVLIPLSFILHILINHFAFYLKITKVKW